MKNCVLCPTLKTIFFTTRSSVETYDLTDLKMGDTTSLSALFESNYSVVTLIGLETWDTSNITSMNRTFNNCSKLTNLNIKDWDVSNVTDFTSMFSNNYNIEKIDLGGWDTSSATSFQNMFSSCYKLKEIILDDFDFSHITSTNSLNLMLSYSTELKKISAKNWKFNNYGSNYVWSNVSSYVEELDITGWDLGNLTNLQYFFQNFYNSFANYHE